MAAREALAKALLKNVLKNDVATIEKDMKKGDPQTWRGLIRYQLPMAVVVADNPQLENTVLIPKLVAFEIRMLSSLHCAALMGYNDTLMALLDRDVPVDTPLTTGTTALHMAAFGGRVHTVKLLLDVYKADALAVDKYGWTALHYGSTQGSIPVAELLIKAKVPPDARDQDGTTAAYRAHINGHPPLVKYLCRFGDPDDMLNILAEDNNNAPPQDPSVLYSKVNKQGKLSSNKKEKAEELSAMIDLPEYGLVGIENGKYKGKVDKPAVPPKPPQEWSQSLSNSSASPRRSSIAKSAPVRSKGGKMGMGTVRRLIRFELENAFEDADYMFPDGALAGQEKKETLGSSGMGAMTLKNIMREEFARYKAEMDRQNSVSSEVELSPTPGGGNYSDDYEDLYATIANLGTAPEPPDEPVDGPPLPPRNAEMLISIPDQADPTSIEDEILGVTLPRRTSTLSMALTESFTRLVPKLGENWKRLAYALPLESAPFKVQVRIEYIEKQNPGLLEKQASMMLGEWKINKGREANTDALIIGLRKSALNDLISIVEKCTQEFSA